MPSEIFQQPHSQRGSQTQGERRLPAAHPNEAVVQMHRYSELIGLPMMCVEVATGVVLDVTDPHFLQVLPQDVQDRLAGNRS